MLFSFMLQKKLMIDRLYERLSDPFINPMFETSKEKKSENTIPLSQQDAKENQLICSV